MIQKMLEVSTAHITYETAKWLDGQVEATKDNKMDLIVYEKGEYGAFIPLYPEMLIGKLLPESLVLIIGYAMGKECSWIMLDRDIEIIDDLPTHNW
ncbi:hypothetical protein [Bacillus sp. SRB3LM]|uniref:DUF5983 family protein n=1 Tax=Bacillus sp. SRB3LM TaxID=2608689 RepID=UPI001E63B6F2|nr:hypothetical protein [Bacillus sp. SRB3LM]